jgi:glycerol-3-phosphate dehydrogenase subunit C
MEASASATPFTADLCIKCNICTSACPVAAVTDLFPGPKTVGPQAQRFRQPALPPVDRTVDYCSGCGVCSLVCPHGVQVAEMNTIARAAMIEAAGLPLGNRLLSRSELLGRIGSPFAPFSNIPLRLPPLRWLAEWFLGIHHKAPFPSFARPTFRNWFARNAAKDGAALGHYKVVYFHGCSTNYYEPRVGRAAVALLERHQCKVTVAEQNCCGLPMQSNGDFATARAHAQANVAKLAPWVREGYLIVGTSTSCTLALKHEYHSVLGLEGEDVALVAENTRDFFEFLEMLADEGKLQPRLNRYDRRVFYHAPCQLRSHGIGHPAMRLLRRIPDIQLAESRADCCGVAGTYGLKREKYGIATAVGRTLFDEIRDFAPDVVACDSETCRWWIQHHTGIRALHPAEILAEAYAIRLR